MNGSFVATRPRRAIATIALLVAALAAGLSARSASAHAFVQRSDPAANAVLATPPRQITIWFTERLEFSSSDAELYDQSGKQIPGAKSRPGTDPTMLILDVPSALADGTYSVVWHSLSADDGHEADGYFAFTVGTQANVVPVVPPATLGPAGPPGWLQTISRWVAFLGLAAAVAIWPVWLLVLRPAIAPAWQAGPALTRRVHRLAVYAIALALLGNLFALLVQADSGAGGYAHQVVVTLRETRYGRLWLLRIGLLFAYAAVLLAAGWWWPWRRKLEAGAGLTLAALLPVPFSLLAHAAAQPTGRDTAVAFDVLHLLAACLWVGGLLLLVAGLLPTLRRLPPGRRRAVLVRGIPRFSLLALTAWDVLGLTGLYSAWLQVGNWAGLRHTAYGHTLTIKVLLLVPLLALGAFNLLIVTRRLRRAEQERAEVSWSRHFAQAVGLEAMLVVAVLLVVGQLTRQAPAREVLTSEAGQAILNLRAEGRSATLAVAPATPGFNHDRLEIAGTTLPPNTTALLRVTPPGQTFQSDIPLVRAAGNAFEAHTSDFSLLGDWSIQVIVRPPNADEWSATTNLAIGKAPPSADVPGTPWRFHASGIAGLLLLVGGMAGVVAAALVARGPLRKETGGLGLAALVVGAVILLQARVGTGSGVAEATLPSDNPIPASAASVARGQQLFAANCAACHGIDGKGDGPAAAGLSPPVADLTSAHSRTHLDQDFFYWIQNGIQGSAMPAFKAKLTDNQIWDLINYVRVDFQGRPGTGGGTPAAAAAGPPVAPGTPVAQGNLRATLLPPVASAGGMPLAVAVTDVSGAPVSGARVTFTPLAPNTGAPGAAAPATAAGAGRYAATVRLDESGTWQIEVRVASATDGAAVFRFALIV